MSRAERGQSFFEKAVEGAGVVIGEQQPFLVGRSDSILEQDQKDNTHLSKDLGKGATILFLTANSILSSGCSAEATSPKTGNPNQDSTSSSGEVLGARITPGVTRIDLDPASPTKATSQEAGWQPGKGKNFEAFYPAKDWLIASSTIQGPRSKNGHTPLISVETPVKTDYSSYLKQKSEEIKKNPNNKGLKEGEVMFSGFSAHAFEYQAPRGVSANIKQIIFEGEQGVWMVESQFAKSDYDSATSQKLEADMAKMLDFLKIADQPATVKANVKIPEAPTPKGAKHIKSPLAFELDCPEAWLFNGNNFIVDKNVSPFGFKDNIVVRVENYTGDFEFFKEQERARFKTIVDNITITANMKSMPITQQPKVDTQIKPVDITIGGTKGAIFTATVRDPAMLGYSFPYADLGLSIYDSKINEGRLVNIIWAEIVLQKDGKAYSIYLASDVSSDQDVKSFGDLNSLIIASFKPTK